MLDRVVAAEALDMDPEFVPKVFSLFGSLFLGAQQAPGEATRAAMRALTPRLTQRGTDTLLFYSDTDPGREELARHFGPSGCRLRPPSLRIATIKNADYDITSEARRAYFELLSKHVDRATGAIPAKPAPERPQIVAQAA